MSEAANAFLRKYPESCEMAEEFAEVMWELTRHDLHSKADIARYIAGLKLDLHAARKGLIATQLLIEESEGVYGLHLNGDPAPWDDLLAEEWLIDFSHAVNELGDGHD